MIQVFKKVGETPLELLERVRREQPALATEKLSYAGRLDPMASGQMIVLVGEENAPEHRARFLGLDKEYIATFLIGVKTDTGDCLGLVRAENARDIEKVEAVLDEVKNQSVESIAQQVESLKQIKTQTYPWFSGKAVNGIKLFDHFKSGNLDIERPILDVHIKEVELLNVQQCSAAEIEAQIFDALQHVSPAGDFRQKEIRERWTNFFEKIRAGGNDNLQHVAATKSATIFQTLQIRIVVSSGTFIRALTENFEFPAMLLQLERTKIIGL